MNLWKSSKQIGNDSMRLTVKDILEEAKIKTSNLQASGSTNINEALLTAISMAKKIARNKHYESVKQHMIIFLTDGEATVGETYNDQIKKNVEEAIGKTEAQKLYE